MVLPVAVAKSPASPPRVRDCLRFGQAGKGGNVTDLPDFAKAGARCLPASACPRFQAQPTTFGLAASIRYVRAIGAEQLQLGSPFADSEPL